MMNTFMVTFCFHIEFHRKATVINCCELKKLKLLKRRLLLYMCYNVIDYYKAVSYKIIIYNEVFLPRFGPVLWKSTQINVCSAHFSLDLSYKQSVRICLIFARNKWDLVSINCKGRSPCQRGLTSSASRGQGPLVY